MEAEAEAGAPVTARLAIVDVETTGLDEGKHEIWEVALILTEVPGDGAPEQGRPTEEYLWQLPIDHLEDADPTALRLNHFYDRRWPPCERGAAGPEYEAEAEDDRQEARRIDGLWEDPSIDDPVDARGRPLRETTLCVTSAHAWAYRFAELTAECVLVGANPAFDDRWLSRLLDDLGVAPAWHYRPINIEDLAVGYLLGRRSALLAPVTIRGYERPSYPSLIALLDERGPRNVEKPRVPPVLGEAAAAIAVPWSSSAVARECGVDVGKYDKHTALGDCRWVLDLLREITGDSR